MAHLSDLSWNKSGDEALGDYKKGQVVRAKVLDVDVEKERISLGIKQLGEDPFESQLAKTKKGDVVTCTILTLTDTGIEVRVGDLEIRILQDPAGARTDRHRSDAIQLELDDLAQALDLHLL